MEVRKLEPKNLWNHFADLNQVPRPSKKEGRVIDFIIAFGKGLNLETFRDEIGNVLIRKPATKGYEKRETIVLQAHLDMVHQKNADTVFDFDNQGINMLVEGDWVNADGTTLGADNGIGVAAIMAILSAQDIEHPAIEALFTIDEETGMSGAMELNLPLEGRILLNLDTEDDRELCIGCAGGVDTTSSFKYKEVPVVGVFSAFQLKVKGLTGGHSGMDIQKGRGNANKLMNRVLYALNAGLQTFAVSSIEGGGLRNAIPRESVAVVLVSAEEHVLFEKIFSASASAIKEEFSLVEERLLVAFEEVAVPASVMCKEDLTKVLSAIYAIPNGVFRMSPAIQGLVETSSNLAKVVLKDGVFETQSLQRSSVDSTKIEVSTAVRAALENIGCSVTHSGDYPGWKPNPASPILEVLKAQFELTFGFAPDVQAVHAGLECGILGGHFEGMDMISFGPTIHGAHSPEETVQISSVLKFWNFLKDVLKNSPIK